MKQRKNRSPEHGFLLLDCLLSVPLLAMMMIALGLLLCTGIHSAFRFWADAELHQEVQMAFRRIVQDAELAYEIHPYATKTGVVFYQHQPPKASGNQRPIQTAYWIHKVSGIRKLVWRDVSQPLTGNYSLAAVEIEAFTCEPAGRGLYELRLVGCSRVTGHRYALSTRVLLPEDGAANENRKEPAG